MILVGVCGFGYVSRLFLRILFLVGSTLLGLRGVCGFAGAEVMFRLVCVFVIFNLGL